MSNNNGDGDSNDGDGDNNDGDDDEFWGKSSPSNKTYDLITSAGDDASNKPS